MKYTLTIAIAAVVAAILIAAGAGLVFARQTAETGAFDMDTDADANGIPDDYENAYREATKPPPDGGIDSAAMERFADGAPVSEETRRMRDEMDAKTMELLSSTSEARQIELLKEIQELSDRMAEDPAISEALEYLDRIESQDAVSSSGAGDAGDAGGAGGAGAGVN